jgi:hypothetical protein
MLAAIAFIVVVLCVFGLVCAVFRAMSDNEQLVSIAAVIVAVVGGIGYAFGGAPGCLAAIGLLLLLCACIIVNLVLKERDKRRRDEAARAEAERNAKRQQQDLARVQSAYPIHWTAQRVWGRPGWVDTKGWKEERQRLSDLLGPSDIRVTRERDDDIRLFTVARVRNIEATDSFLAEARRTRASELRGDRQCVREKMRQQQIERAAQEADERALQARIAQQTVVSLSSLPPPLPQNE